MICQKSRSKLDAFFSFNEREILNHSGKISAQVADLLALEHYAEFDAKRKHSEQLKARAFSHFFLEHTPHILCQEKSCALAESGQR